MPRPLKERQKHTISSFAKRLNKRIPYGFKERDLIGQKHFLGQKRIMERRIIVDAASRSGMGQGEQERLAKFLNSALKLSKERGTIAEEPSIESLKAFKQVLEKLKKEHNFDAPAIASIEEHTIQWALYEISEYFERRKI